MKSWVVRNWKLAEMWFGTSVSSLGSILLCNQCGSEIYLFLAHNQEEHISVLQYINGYSSITFIILFYSNVILKIVLWLRAGTILVICDSTWNLTNSNLMEGLPRPHERQQFSSLEIVDFFSQLTKSNWDSTVQLSCIPCLSIECILICSAINSWCSGNFFYHGDREVLFDAKSHFHREKGSASISIPHSQIHSCVFALCKAKHMWL